MAGGKSPRALDQHADPGAEILAAGYILDLLFASEDGFVSIAVDADVSVGGAQCFGAREGGASNVVLVHSAGLGCFRLGDPCRNCGRPADHSGGFEKFAPGIVHCFPGFGPWIIGPVRLTDKCLDAKNKESLFELSTFCPRSAKFN